MKILAVNAWDHRETPGRIQDFARKEELLYTVLIGGGSVLRETYQGNSIPHTFFINRDGKIVSSQIGAAGMEALEREVRRILK